MINDEDFEQDAQWFLIKVLVIVFVLALAAIVALAIANQ